jgi:hypothetical protein
MVEYPIYGLNARIHVRKLNFQMPTVFYLCGPSHYDFLNIWEPDSGLKIKFDYNSAPYWYQAEGKGKGLT